MMLDLRVRPGSYLTDMRESAGLTIAEVAQLLTMLGLARQRAAPWFRFDIARALAAIEADKRRPTEAQLLTLALVLPVSISQFRRLAAAQEVEHV